MIYNIHIYGIVQGVGFRPFISVTASNLGIQGTVANKGSYVEVIAQTDKKNVELLLKEIQTNAPERSIIFNITIEELFISEDAKYDSFSIIESESDISDCLISPDISVCEKCKSEMFDKKNRRYLHPFINCTQCGPRLTILKKIPYDRINTSMSSFPMCPNCNIEYHDFNSRRYDAQPNCCNNCGPELYIIGTNLFENDAIKAIRNAIMSGKIVGIKGIGGFHLCCDARNPKVVSLLRKIKHRPSKPFAIMMKDEKVVEKECFVDSKQLELLNGWQKPIILLKKRNNTTLCSDIAPHNSTIGVMLPYTPLHMLLFDFPDNIDMTDSLIMTSGNTRGAPICHNDNEAMQEISQFCDLILSNNREIVIRADDSVCDWLDEKPYMIRRSRGFAPLPIMVPQKSHPQILAVGGELKSTFCIAKNGLLYSSPYVGDMTDIRTISAFRDSAMHMIALLELKPEIILCDLHPNYNSVMVAYEMANEFNIPVIPVQHHYAHILSCMAENRVFDSVIGLSFDGTGYGDDDTIWGGEILICTPSTYKRVGNIQSFFQTGGDLFAKEGWRAAVVLLYDIFKEKTSKICDLLSICNNKEYQIQLKIIKNGIGTIKSTSCGRLFDAVSAILGICRYSSFEGEASTSLMFEAEMYVDVFGETAPIFNTEVKIDNEYIILWTTRLIADITNSFIHNQTEENRKFLAYQFHVTLAKMLVNACVSIRQNTGVNKCVLSGGVFQNRLLIKLCQKMLCDADFTVYLHSSIAPNDSGICVGQAMYGIFSAYN